MLETKVSLQGVKRNEWLNLRKTGLGGSDAGAVCESIFQSVAGLL